MPTSRVRFQLLVAAVYLAALLVALRLLRSALPPGGLVPDTASLWQQHGAVLVFAAIGALFVAFHAWGARNRVGAAFVAVVLTVVVVTLPTGLGLVTVDWLTRLWRFLWLQNSLAAPVVVWGATLATCVAAYRSPHRPEPPADAGLGREADGPDGAPSPSEPNTGST